MYVHSRIKASLIILLSLFTADVDAIMPYNELTLLDIDFNNKTPGALIGDGGAELGEPSSLGELTAEVVGNGPGENYLLVEYNGVNTNLSHSLRWEFLDDKEVTEGKVFVSLQITTSAYDHYSIRVRENSFSSNNFINMIYFPEGNFTLRDAAGPITGNQSTYVAGDTQNIDFIFDMDAGTSAMLINGDVVFSGRQHGISGAGVGSLITGYSHLADHNSFILDNIQVIEHEAIPLVLAADFEDKNLGQTIGTGGALMGEPVSVDIGLDTKVVNTSVSKALSVSNPGGGELSLDWEFIHDIEFTNGFIAVDMDIEFSVLDNYQISFVKHTGIKETFTTVNFAKNSEISITDSDGSAGVVGQYEAEQMYQLRLIYNMDTGLYNVELNSEVLLEEHPHDFNTGNGTAVLKTGFHPNSNKNSEFTIDNLYVRANEFPDIIFVDDFE